MYIRELFRYSMEMLVDFVDAACSHRNAVKIFVRRKRIAIFPSSTCMLESWLISTAEKQMLNHRRKEYYKSRGGACVFYRQHLTIKETTCKRTMCCNYWNRDDIIRSNAKTLLRKCLERFMYFFCFVLNNLEIYFQFDKNGNSCCAYRMEDR